MATFVFKANITDKHGNPLIGVEVEAINCNDFTPALADPIQHVIALATTDISGTATFTGLAPGMYYARPRLTRPDIRIQVMVPSGMGGGGKMCYAALVNPAAGIGTHTTIQSAITALGTTGGLVFICAGTYQENLVVAGDTDDLWLVGAGRGEVLIQGTAASPTITVEAVGTGGVTRFRLEHLTIDHTGAQTLLYFNSVAGGIPTQVDLLDLRFVSGTVGIDFSDINGGSRFTLRDIIMESTVIDAGQLEVADLVITNLRTYCTGDGLYVSGVTAANVIRISDSHIGAGGDFALRIGVGNDIQVANTKITALGAKGILIGNAVEVTLDNVIVDMTDGVGIDAGGIGTAISISDCKLTCASSQSPAKAGITIAGTNSSIHIADTRINGFESFGIQLETLVAGGAQHFVLDGVTIINGEDTHSISITGWDFGTITGCVLVGTGGGNTTYGVYGDANTTYVVIVGNVSEGHDGLTNLTNGVDGNVIGTNTGDGTGLGPSPHDAVTLDVNADTLLSLSTQELGLDTQLANLVFAGAVSGGAAVPAFRSLVDADIPAAIMRDQEHTDIGDAAPHHARLHAMSDILDHSATNWRMFYSDGSAHVIEIALGADGTFLQSGGAAVLPEFTALVAGDIPDISATYIAKAFMAAKGDLIGASANDTPLILSIGADTHVLTADSGEATGMKWAAAAGGGGTKIEDADTDTKVDVEEGADEDIVRMDVAGTERFVLQDSAPHLLVTGIVKITDHLSVVGNPFNANTIFTADGTESGSPAVGGYIRVIGDMANGAQVTMGLTGSAIGRGTPALSFVYGLYFGALHGTSSDCNTLTGILTYIGSEVAGSGAIADARGIHVSAPSWGGSKPATVKGVEIADQGHADVTTAYGLHILDQTATTVRLLEIGPATPYLRLVGGGAPGAGLTNLYLDEGGTLRQVKCEATREIFIHPRGMTETTPAEPASNYWPLMAPTAVQGVYFLWKVPSDFASLNSVNVVMVPDATETIQADLGVAVVAVGENYNVDNRGLVNQQLAVTASILTEWDIKLGTIFDGIAADDYVSIRFNSDTDTLRIAGCRISYEARKFTYLD